MESMWNHALVRCLISHCCVCPASSLKVQRPDLNDKLKRAEARRKEEEERRREELQRREEEQQRKELRRKEEEERKRAELEVKQKLKEDRSKAAKQAVAAASTKPEATKPAVAAVAAATKPEVLRQTAAAAVVAGTHASAAGGSKEEVGPAVGAPLQGRSANIMPPAAAALLLPGAVVKKAAAAATVPPPAAPPAAPPGFSAMGLAAATASSAGNQNNAPTPSFRAPPMAAQYPPMTPAEMVRALTDNPPNSDKSPQIHRVTFSFVLIFTFWNALCPSGSGREEHQAVGHLALRQPRRPAPHTGGLQGHQPGPQL